MEKPLIDFSDFEKVQILAGRIVDVEPFERARVPAYRVRIDFGPDFGERNSSLQARSAYSEAEMLGKLVVAVVNLPPKNVAGFQSEVLVLGVPADEGSLSLLEPGRGARLGAAVY